MITIKCSRPCGVVQSGDTNVTSNKGQRVRQVACVDEYKSSTILPEIECDLSTKPENSSQCMDTDNLPCPVWSVAEWSEVSRSFALLLSLLTLQMIWLQTKNRCLVFTVYGYNDNCSYDSCKSQQTPDKTTSPKQAAKEESLWTMWKWHNSRDIRPSRKNSKMSWSQRPRDSRVSLSPPK